MRLGWLVLAASLFQIGGIMKPVHQITDDSAPRQAMQKLAALLRGRWNGQGWVEFESGRRDQLECTAIVEEKSDGTVLLFDTPYTLRHSAETGEATPHNEIAILSYDPASQQYLFDIYFAGGRHETGTVSIEKGVVTITNALSNGGFRRITIDRSSRAQWRDIGERSTDGKVWKKYSEVNLARAPD